MTTKRDLQFLEKLFLSFFKPPHVRKTLFAINESGITGWEKWLQVELATHLLRRSDVRSWDREIRMSSGQKKGRQALSGLDRLSCSPKEQTLTASLGIETGEVDRRMR